MKIKPSFNRNRLIYIWMETSNDRKNTHKHQSGGTGRQFSESDSFRNKSLQNAMCNIWRFAL